MVGTDQTALPNKLRSASTAVLGPPPAKQAKTAIGNLSGTVDPSCLSVRCHAAEHCPLRKHPAAAGSIKYGALHGHGNRCETDIPPDYTQPFCRPPLPQKRRRQTGNAVTVGKARDLMWSAHSDHRSLPWGISIYCRGQWQINVITNLLNAERSGNTAGKPPVKPSPPQTAGT